MSRQNGYVLVVDDDPDILDAISFVLDTEGYRSETATNGSDALARIREGKPPCLILLDLMMPVMNGWEFRATQLEDPALSHIPVVPMTGLGRVAQTASLNAPGVLEKPIDLEKLLATVVRYCQ
jgi:CheY-like chemotaxis protein